MRGSKAKMLRGMAQGRTVKMPNVRYAGIRRSRLASASDPDPIVRLHVMTNRMSGIESDVVEINTVQRVLHKCTRDAYLRLKALYKRGQLATA